MFTNQDDENVKKTLNRRMFLLLGAESLLFTVLAGRLYKLQIHDAEKYLLQAEENRINVSLVEPERGRIFDRNGLNIASNKQNLQLYIISEQTESVYKTLKEIQAVVPLSDAKIEYLLKKRKTMASFEKLPVVDNMSWSDFSKIGFHSPSLSGVHLFSGVTRRYPFGNSLAHLVGYTGEPTFKDVKQDVSLKQSNDFQIGKTGVEKVYESLLRGKEGQRQYEVNAHGRVVRELSKIPSTSGKDVVLTVDAQLQNFIFKRFGKQSGAAVVIDVTNGHVLAMMSAPSYNPELFVKGISRKQWQHLIDDPLKPLSAKAQTGVYPPGSVFKMNVALAALQYKQWKADTVVDCPGYYRIGKHVMRCWKKKGHGKLDLSLALKKSCDVYFYTMAKEIGVEAMADMGYHLGLSTKYTDLGVSNIKKGVLPTPQWKKQTLGKVWYPGETIIAGIGQGFVTATPLELAVMMARIASGKKVVPNLLLSTGYAGAYGKENISQFEKFMGQEFDDLVVDQEYIRFIQDSMWGVVNEWGGTAYRARLGIDNFEMAGKTGTAQVIRITEDRKEESQDTIPRKFRDHALFVAYAPYHNPRYALSIVVEHGKSGSKTAAPIAKDIMTYLYSHYE